LTQLITSASRPHESNVLNISLLIHHRRQYCWTQSCWI